MVRRTGVRGGRTKVVRGVLDRSSVRIPGRIYGRCSGVRAGVAGACAVEHLDRSRHAVHCGRPERGIAADFDASKRVNGRSGARTHYTDHDSSATDDSVGATHRNAYARDRHVAAPDRDVHPFYGNAGRSDRDSAASRSGPGNARRDARLGVSPELLNRRGRLTDHSSRGSGGHDHRGGHECFGRDRVARYRGVRTVRRAGVPALVRGPGARGGRPTVLFGGVGCPVRCRAG